jgi:hypothetical protein
MEDHFYDTLLNRRNLMTKQYQESVMKQKQLDHQCMQLMQKLVDSDTSLSDMVDGYFSYKFNRYKARLDIAVKKMTGQVVCDSDIIMPEEIHPQYLFNSLSDKLIS